MRIILGFALLLAVRPFADTARADGYYGNGGYIPVYPRYPYRSGHYPKADWYYHLPPYAAIDPRFYRKRFFMMAQERNRYRYMPYIFHGYDDGEQIEDIDLQGIGESLKSSYRD